MFDAVYHFDLLEPDFQPDAGRYYCPVCISQVKPGVWGPTGWSTRSQVRSHLGAGHGWEEPLDLHALSHQELVRALVEWRRVTEMAAENFDRRLTIVRGVDDFLLECGS